MGRGTGTTGAGGRGALAALRAERDALATTLDSMRQGVCLFGANGRLRVANRRFSEVVGVPRDAVRSGMSHDEVVAACVGAMRPDGVTVEDAIRAEARALGEVGEDCPFEDVTVLADGRSVSRVISLVPGGGWIATYDDVTERVTSEQRVSHMASHDALTDLANRTRMKEELEGAIRRGNGRRGCALHYLDLDHFKAVNDTMGHPVGDTLLVQVADRLRGCVRERDTVARLGGDEFAIVQTGVSCPADAEVVAARVVRELCRPFDIDGQVVNIGVSIGITVAPTDGDDVDRLVKNADVALYKAKECRGTWRFFEASMDEVIQARRLVETELRGGMARGEFAVHYQPILDLRNGRATGIEALVRWQHPERGLVSPNDFIKVAEEIGVIRELGGFVLRQACADAARCGDVRVAVNVSPVQMREASFVDEVVAALAETGLAPERLEVEITEEALMGRGVDPRRNLARLKDAGVRLSLDDFGTGFSSLSCLRTFPIDRIKIDRSFVRNLGEGRADDVVARSIVQLALNMGIQVTAEGVETEAQRNWLRREGCHEIQGYLVSPPRPVGDLAPLMATWRRGRRAA